MLKSIPFATRNQKIGLLGGSFDPPHNGHKNLTLNAIKRFNLDQVWWLITPKNPLKVRNPTSIELRINAAQALMDHPRVHITDIETQLNTRYTAETLRALCEIRPDLRFVWLMGADNLANFHNWHEWQSIIRSVPLGICARPGFRMRALNSRTAKIYRSAKIPQYAARTLAEGNAPRWAFINTPMSNLSSTQLRSKEDVASYPGSVR